MARTLKAVGSVLVLFALIVALPVMLVALGGNPLPGSVPSLDEITAVLGRPDDGSLFIGALTIAGWIGWATFTLSVIVELPAQLRGVSAPQLRGLGPQQRLAAVLIAAVLAMLLAPAQAATAAPATDDAGSTTTVQSIDTTQTAASEPEVEQDQNESAQHAAPTGPIHEVQPGESLWSIADEHLGDGLRWTEIRDLNAGIIQPDGYSLQVGSEWIEPGWRLTMPADAPDAATDEQDTRYTVQPGDTLYDIADEHLGDGNRYPEIVDASRSIDQGGGIHLTDPDVIDIGWTLALPATETTLETASDDTAAVDSAAGDEPAEVAPQEAAGDDAGEMAAAEEESLAEEEAADNQGADEAQAAGTVLVDTAQDVDQLQNADVDDEPPMNVRTIGGVGSILAAGILGVLALRRQRAQRTRRPGQRLALPTPGTPDSQIEAELQAIADPIGMDTVNAALRDLGAWCTSQQQPLPDVRAARLTADGTEFQLYLDAPSQLPSPWTGSADQRIWILAADDIDTDLLTRTDPDDVPAPWPSLVTLGHDEEDAALLLDLEQVGHLDIRGGTEPAHGTLAALAVELATSQWADDLQVTLIGTLPDLPDAVDTSRLRYVTGIDAVMRELRARAEDIGAADATTTEAWTPEILIVGTTLAPDIRDELDELVSSVPRVGVAAVTTDADTGEWALDIDPETPAEAVLSPTELRIRPQQITTADYAAMLSVLTGAEQHIPGPTWAEHLSDRIEPTLDELPAPIAEDEPADDEEAEEPAAAETVAAVHVTTVHIEATTETDQVADPVTTPHTPAVLMLGDVDLAAITAGEIAPSHRDQALELIAYLSLHPQADTDAISAALWPDIDVKASTRKSAVSRARKLLGVDEDGRPYLPHTTTSSAGNPYELQGISSDWAHFCDLRGTDVTTTPLQQLLQALSLVRGEPFSRIRTGRTRVRAGRYVWAEPHIREMSASIVDVACEAAHRALTEGRPKAAAQAAQAGLRATLDDERVWRYAIRAADQTGDQGRVTQLVTDLTTHLTTLEVDPQPETNDLLDQLDTRHHRAAG